jgi:hypothetical protein
MHSLVLRYGDRRQNHSTFFLRNRPELELIKRLASDAPHGSALGAPSDIALQTTYMLEKRYPIPLSVKMYDGRSGLRSIFCRKDRMNTRRSCGSVSPPQISLSKNS